MIQLSYKTWPYSRIGHIIEIYNVSMTLHGRRILYLLITSNLFEALEIMLLICTFMGRPLLIITPSGVI